MFTNKQTMSELVKDFPFLKKIEEHYDMIYIKSPSYRNLYEDALNGRAWTCTKRGALHELDFESGSTLIDLIEENTKFAFTLRKDRDRCIATLYLIFNPKHWIETAA